MADDLEAELSALEDKAPLTETNTADDDGQDFGPGNPKPEKDDAVEAKDGEPSADEWKPPTREHFENIQKGLRAERERARAAERERVRIEQNAVLQEQRIQAWQQQVLAQQLSAPPPDVYEHPEAARQRLEQQSQLLRNLHQAEQQRQQQVVQERQVAQQFEYVARTVDDYEGEFRAQQPDYDDATDHILSTQQAMLEQMGYPPEVAQQQINSWAINIAQQSLQAGRNPAPALYEMAKRMGYQPKGTGVEAAAEKLAAMRAGQGSAKTLSGGGGAKNGGTSLKSILSLDGAAFDSAMDKYLNDQIRAR